MTADAEAAAERVDALLAELRRGADPRAAAVADELARCLVQLYGAGLARIVAGIGAELTAELCTDPLVESLLLIHDLHPFDADTRIRVAVERARPRLGDVRYLGIDDAGVAHLRLTAGTSGCGSSRQAGPREVEAVVRQAAPELTDVTVETPAAPPPLLQVSLRPGLAHAETAR
jgi:Fe-S cluster biogenesis protein NfuA